jgi:hypothetical protein
MLDVPSVLHGQAEIRGYSRSNRTVPKEIRHKLHQEDEQRPTAIAGSTGYPAPIRREPMLNWCGVNFFKRETIREIGIYG